jgi:hypothetical protein
LGNYQILEGIDAERFQRIDLFGNPHAAELGSDPRAHAPANKQARHPRTQNAEHADADRRGNQPLSAEPAQRATRVHRHHHAWRQTGHYDQRSGSRADVDDLTRPFSEFPGRTKQLARGFRAEYPEVAGCRKKMDQTLEHPSQLGDANSRPFVTTLLAAG